MGIVLSSVQLHAMQLIIFSFVSFIIPRITISLYSKLKETNDLRIERASFPTCNPIKIFLKFSRESQKKCGLVFIVIHIIIISISYKIAMISKRY